LIFRIQKQINQFLIRKSQIVKFYFTQNLSNALGPALFWDWQYKQKTKQNKTKQNRKKTDKNLSTPIFQKILMRDL